MGTFTKTFTPTADCIVTESYLYSPVELNTSKDVKRVKISRTLWDTGASCSLISERIAKLLNLEPIGKTGVTGYNSNIDVKDTYLIHAGLPTGDIVTNIMAMACESDEYDAIFGMDIISLGDFAITNQNGQTTFSFRIPDLWVILQDRMCPNPL